MNYPLNMDRVSKAVYLANKKRMLQLEDEHDKPRIVKPDVRDSWRKEIVEINNWLTRVEKLRLIDDLDPDE
jgi:hypothetical protein